MEFSLNHPLQDTNYLELIIDTLPHDCSKSVSSDVMNMLSHLPVEIRLQDDQLLDLNPNDVLLRSYLRNALEEVAEIRNSIKSLSPFLRNSQQVVQNNVFAYARNHTSYSRRVRSLNSSKKIPNTDSDDTSTKSVFRRAWHRLLSIIPGMGNRGKEMSEKKKVKEAFQNFYVNNGVSFRSLMTRTMARCKRLELLLSNIKRQIKQFDFNATEVNDSVAGIAYQLRVHRGHMTHWRKDFDFVLKQARNVRRLFGLVPVHNCWEAIFNIMTSQGQLNHYV